MYYSYKCTYCGRVFYTYDRSRENASVVLYRSIKQHLIDYNEDHKEHEMDDGEATDSNEIYVGIRESSEVPQGGYEASGKLSSSEAPSTTSSSSNRVTLILLVIGIIIFILLVLFVPGLFEYFKQMIPTV